jgi:hypothetical protein
MPCRTSIFHQPPAQFAKPISFQTDFNANFNADFQAPIRGEPAAPICCLPACSPNGGVSSRLEGSYRICMVAMNLAGDGPNPFLPRFTCRDFVNTHEHFIFK